MESYPQENRILPAYAHSRDSAQANQVTTLRNH
jgi:hypothetical protein